MSVSLRTVLQHLSCKPIKLRYSLFYSPQKTCAKGLLRVGVSLLFDAVRTVTVFCESISPLHESNGRVIMLTRQITQMFHASNIYHGKYCRQS